MTARRGAPDTVGGGDGDPRSRRPEGRLVRVVARLPVKVRTKLLFAFAVIAALLLAVAALGLRVLGQSNARVVSLGTLQVRASTYQSLQTQANQLRQMLAIRVAEDPDLGAYLGGTRPEVRAGESWPLVDKAIAAALTQLGPATSVSHLGFAPPAGDEVALIQIRAQYRRFVQAVARMTELDGPGATSRRTRPYLKTAIDADNRLGALTDELASRARAQTDALIRQNRSAYIASRNLFVVVGAASIALAILLGFVLSGSLVGPIRKTEGGLAQIAGGDFTQHLEVPNRDELGALAANVNLMNDELRRLYEELETVSRHKSEFLATVSHELRTPLNAIIGFSELLHLQSFGPLNEHQLSYLDDILDAARHLLSLINDILDLSKVEAGHMELDLSEVSLRAVLESGCVMFAERASNAGVELRLALEFDDVTLRADERKLRQVVFNLVSNAVKFTPAGGRVGISGRTGDGVVEVAVADSGPGIPFEETELIFEEFRQGRAQPGIRPEGTGLGLPLSRKLVELHGGRLWVDSVPGRGSTFRLALPIEAPA